MTENKKPLWNGNSIEGLNKKILQRNCIMKKEKTQQEFTVRCFLSDGTEVDPAEVVIPKGHSVYQTLIMQSKNRADKTA